MGLSTEREDPRAPLTPPRSHPTECHREPVPAIEDEMGLLGHRDDPRADRLDWLDISSKPEEYFTCDPRHSKHELL
jgi:hypothetical protein